MCRLLVGARYKTAVGLPVAITKPKKKIDADHERRIIRQGLADLRVPHVVGEHEKHRVGEIARRFMRREQGGVKITVQGEFL